MFTVKYDDLDTHDLLNELEHAGDITCIISHPQALALKRVWDKYELYIHAKKDRVPPFTIVIRALSLWVTQLATDIKYPNIQKINEVYILGGHRIMPVQFSKQDNSDVHVIFRRKQKTGPEAV